MSLFYNKRSRTASKRDGKEKIENSLDMMKVVVNRPFILISFYMISSAHLFLLRDSN
jgi:hypothetical protein